MWNVLMMLKHVLTYLRELEMLTTYMTERWGVHGLEDSF
jgi:hypothetical protein